MSEEVVDQANEMNAILGERILRACAALDSHFEDGLGEHVRNHIVKTHKEREEWRAKAMDVSQHPRVVKMQKERESVGKLLHEANNRIMALEDEKYSLEQRAVRAEDRVRDLEALREFGGEAIARLTERERELTQERDGTVAAMEEEIIRWQNASGLEQGGDPGGVTPEAMEKYWAKVEADRDAAQAQAADMQQMANDQEQRAIKAETERNAALADNAALKDERKRVLSALGHPAMGMPENAVFLVLERLRRAEAVVATARVYLAYVYDDLALNAALAAYDEVRPKTG